jgi:hypothetical protein
LLLSRRLLLNLAALVFASTAPAVAKTTSGPLSNCLHGDNEHRRDLPEERDLLFMVNYTARACDAMLDAHGEDCGCFLCDDVHGLRYNLSVGLSHLESSLFTRIGNVVNCPCCGQPWNDGAA